MKIVIFGSTGMIGRAALLAAQSNPDVREIMAVVRRDELPAHPKLKIFIHPNMLDLSPLAGELRGVAGTIYAIGVTSAGMSEEQYTSQTFDMTLTVAKSLLAYSPLSRFVYVSGAGADSSEKGPVMWARVRGKLENTLLAMPFVGSYSLRPAMIIPQDGIQSKTPAYRIAYFFTAPFLPLARKFLPNQITTTRILGNLLVSLATKGTEKKILESKNFSS